MQIDVILRTCSNSLLTPSDKQRICGGDRQTLIRKCFYSLVEAIRASSNTVTLTVLDDNSDERFLNFLRETSNSISCNIISLKDKGFNNSALEQFKLASECSGLVYIVEDDYLHEENAIDHMVGAYLHFMKRYNTQTVIYPYDCSLRYKDGEESETTLYHDGMRYWRSVDKTANTMLTHYSTIEEHWLVFKELAEKYPKVLEDDTINQLYHSTKNPTAPIRAFNPIPSIAYHVGYSTPVSISTTHMSWMHLWERIEDWQLIQGWFYYPEFYQHVANNMQDGARLVEIGTWRGRSTCCLASYLKKTGKNARIYAVDTFDGSDEPIHRTLIDSMPVGLYDDFRLNLKSCNVDDIVVPIKSTSIDASKRFEDGSIDFIMIDGSHDYDSVKADIEHWLPKLKSNGLMAGDDHSDSWPGVKKAVREIFGTNYNTHGDLWYIVK